MACSIPLLLLTVTVSSSLAANTWFDEMDPNRYTDHHPPHTAGVYGNPPPGAMASPPLRHRPVRPADLTQLCASVYCQPPTVCRVSQLCPRCRAVPNCVNPVTLPPGSDQHCWAYRYRQAIVLSSPGSPPRTLRCLPWMPTVPRGGCQPGSQCVPTGARVRTVATGICCAGPLAPGAVPPAAAPAQLPPAVMPLPAVVPMLPAAPRTTKAPPALPALPAAGPPPQPLHMVSPQALPRLPPAPVVPYNFRPGVCPPIKRNSCFANTCKRDDECSPFEVCCPHQCGCSCIVPPLVGGGPPSPGRGATTQG